MHNLSTPEDLDEIARRLQRPDAYPHSTGRFELIETHISVILLTGEFAYKLKKPVNLGFLDFSTAEKREHYCYEEVRLNRRLAPEIYLGVVAVTDGKNGPEIDGDGPAIWHAVHMHQFARNRELDVLVPKGELQRSHIDKLAIDFARFHEACPRSATNSLYGTPDIVAHYMLECFDQSESGVHGDQRKRLMDKMRRWCLKALSDKASELLKRKQNGYVREGHGDLHLRNMLLLDGRVVPFDCLEFNSELRWIDVISDIAFLLMDLDYHGHHELSAAFLSGYLERTGDYGGLSLLPLYQVYRAMVRCKVACIRETQEREAAESTAEAEHEANRHLDLAHAYLHRSRPRLIITCGLSGSGKTTLAATVLAPLGAIRIRSDVERKRIAGIALKDACHGGEFNRGLYSPEMTRRTYRRLITLAAVVVENGWSVIVDAAFLNRSEREEFRTVAKRMGASFVILNCTAPRRVLVERIQKRAEKGEDPSDADSLVLKNQITYAELPAVDESEYVIEVDTTGEIDVGAVVNRIRSICDS
jgi:aminoglycoside phosphotransferase family enzyme/gluconate kinase